MELAAFSYFHAGRQQRPGNNATRPQSPCINIINPCMNFRQQYILAYLYIMHSQPDSVSDGKATL